MIGSFRQYLVEENRIIVFSFGRMNPPTIGHGKLLDAMAKTAGKNPYRMYLSQSQDNKKNPLAYKDKLKIARKMFPKHARNILKSDKLKNVFQVATSLYDEGYRNIIMVVGSDRIREFNILLNKYNGKKGGHGFYNFMDIKVVSAGDRDPDAEGVSGMSASKMRAAASGDDFTKFSQGIPKAVSNAESKKIFNMVRKGMGLKEQTEFKRHIQLEPVSDMREAFVSGELFNIDDQIIIKETEEVAIVKQCGTNYLIIEKQDGKLVRKWLDDVEPVEESLWANIRAKRARGEKMRKKGEKGAPTQDAIKRASEDKERPKTQPQDPDIKDREGTQPAGYYKGLKKSTKLKRAAHFAKHGKKADDDNSAYKPAPGDATAKTKPSKHTLRFKQMLGESEAQDLAKARIEREKAADMKRHDRMLDRARLKDTKTKNKESK